MTRERANAIERTVFYPFFSQIIPNTVNVNDAFMVGRVIGMMQERLHRELEKEIDREVENAE